MLRLSLSHCFSPAVVILRHKTKRLRKPDFQLVVREAWIGFGLSHVCFELTSIITANSLTAWRVGGCSLYCILALSVGLQLALCDIWMWTWGPWSGPVWSGWHNSCFAFTAVYCQLSQAHSNLRMWRLDLRVTETKLEIFNWPDKQENSLYGFLHSKILIGKSIHSFIFPAVYPNWARALPHEPAPRACPNPYRGFGISTQHHGFSFSVDTRRLNSDNSHLI